LAGINDQGPAVKAGKVYRGGQPGGAASNNYAVKVSMGWNGHGLLNPSMAEQFR
jgi:hypothetical protein